LLAFAAEVSFTCFIYISVSICFTYLFSHMLFGVFAFNALTGHQEGQQALKNLYFKAPWDGG